MGDIEMGCNTGHNVSKKPNSRPGRKMWCGSHVPLSGLQKFISSMFQPVVKSAVFMLAILFCYILWDLRLQTMVLLRLMCRLYSYIAVLLSRDAFEFEPQSMC